MLDSASVSPAEQVFDTARTAPPAQALQTACLLATGQDGFLAGASHAVHMPGARLVDPASVATDVALRATEQEHGIACFDLVLSVLEPRALRPVPAAVPILVVALRAGLLARTMDQAFGHLEDRESLGMKTLHHQLVKARFSATGGFLNRLRRELALADDAGRLEQPDRLHAEIDTHLVQGAKLMGGHGLRDAAAHGLEYLSVLLRASLVARPGAGV